MNSNENENLSKIIDHDYSSGVDSIDNVIYMKRTMVDIPYGKSNGTMAELKVMEILKRSNIPPTLLLKPKLVKIPLRGEIEISDGIILYGDTAFLMQIKSRNKKLEEVSNNFKSEKRKIESLISHAYKQTNDSIKYIKDENFVVFENQLNNPVEISYHDYNWVSLIIVNHLNLDELNEIGNIESDNSSDRVIPRVIISMQDLEDMSNLFERTAVYILNYLRRLQYQPNHELGNDMRRFANFPLMDIHDYNHVNFFIEYEKSINSLYEDKKISKEISKSLLSGLDILNISDMEKFQKSFKKKFDDTFEYPLKDGFYMPESSTGYITLFYNSQKVPINIDLNAQIGMIGYNYKESIINEGGKAKHMLAIAVDVSPQDKKPTLGFLISEKF